MTLGELIHKHAPPPAGYATCAPCNGSGFKYDPRVFRGCCQTTCPVCHGTGLLRHAASTEAPERGETT